MPNKLRIVLAACLAAIVSTGPVNGSPPLQDVDSTDAPRAIGAEEALGRDVLAYAETYGISATEAESRLAGLPKSLKRLPT